MCKARHLFLHWRNCNCQTNSQRLSLQCVSCLPCTIAPCLAKYDSTTIHWSNEHTSLISRFINLWTFSRVTIMQCKTYRFETRNEKLTLWITQFHCFFHLICEKSKRFALASTFPSVCTIKMSTSSSTTVKTWKINQSTGKYYLMSKNKHYPHFQLEKFLRPTAFAKKVMHRCSKHLRSSWERDYSNMSSYSWTRQEIPISISICKSHQNSLIIEQPN